MSAAVTARPTVMQPSTFTRPAIRSSRAMIRRKAGDGVMSTRLFWTSADAPRRTTGPSRAKFELAQQTTANESAFEIAQILYVEMVSEIASPSGCGVKVQYDMAAAPEQPDEDRRAHDSHP